MSQKSYKKENNLYLIPTPIGNLEDITLRSLNLLKEVDLLLCEDTRETRKLLDKYDIKQKLLSCHEHNEKEIKDKVIEFLNEGKKIGLVTDQGTPMISDPGYIIVQEVINAGFYVIGLPGSTAFVPALISSGIDSTKFLFYGFLNPKRARQLKELENLKNTPYTLIFYESAQRINETLNNLLEIFGNRQIAVAREISKLYEEIYRGDISSVLEEIKDGVKGELVIIVDGNKEVEDYSNLSIVDHVKLYLDEMTEKEAIKKVSKERNIPKSVVYKEYHIKKGEK